MSAEATFLDAQEAADFLRVKVQTIYYWVYVRRIPFRKHGGRLAFARAELERWSEARKVRPLDEIMSGALLGAAAPDLVNASANGIRGGTQGPDEGPSSLKTRRAADDALLLQRKEQIWRSFSET